MVMVIDGVGVGTKLDNHYPARPVLGGRSIRSTCHQHHPCYWFLANNCEPLVYKSGKVQHQRYLLRGRCCRYRNSKGIRQCSTRLLPLCCSCFINASRCFNTVIRRRYNDMNWLRREKRRTKNKEKKKEKRRKRYLRPNFRIPSRLLAFRISYTLFSLGTSSTRGDITHTIGPLQALRNRKSCLCTACSWRH